MEPDSKDQTWELGEAEKGHEVISPSKNTEMATKKEAAPLPSEC